VNTEPFPGSLVTVTSPPIMRASFRVMARPKPVPPKRCAVVASSPTRMNTRSRFESESHKGIGIGSDEMSTPKLEGLAPYCANLIRLSKEIPEDGRTPRRTCPGDGTVSGRVEINPGETGSGLTWSPPFQ
jgi:hypothetical protein